MNTEIDCNECNNSKYAGYASSFKNGEKEFCLWHNKELKETSNRTIPCKECNGKNFKEDTSFNQ